MTATRRWVMIAAIAALVVLAAGYLLVVKPEKSKATDLNTQTEQQNSANSLLLTQISALQSEQKDLPQQQLALQKFTTEVPDSPAEPTLIRQLTLTAQHAGVELVSITPGAPTALSAAASAGTSTLTTTAATPAATLYQMTLALAVVGSYANVEAFFNGIEHMPRAMLVTTFSVCPEVSSGLGGGCSGAALPSNKVPLPSDVGVTLTASVFYAPTDTTTAPPSTTQTLTTPGGTTGTAPTTASTAPAGSPPDVTGPSTTGAAAGQTS